MGKFLMSEVPMGIYCPLILNAIITQNAKHILVMCYSSEELHRKPSKV
jgi:hypothetical protein